MPPSFVIAVSGGSASGKSTLTQSLQRSFSFPVSLLPLDKYYRDLSCLPLEQRAQTNFDHPDSLDISLYVQHLKSLSNGQSVEAPVYDFSTHTRIGKEIVQSTSILFTEGILLLAIPEIRECINFSVFLDVPESIRLERKIHRDTTERSRTEDYAREQFLTTVKPIHDELVIPSMQYADLVLDGTQMTEELTKCVLLAMKKNMTISSL